VAGQGRLIREVSLDSTRHIMWRASAKRSLLCSGESPTRVNGIAFAVRAIICLSSRVLARKRSIMGRRAMAFAFQVQAFVIAVSACLVGCTTEVGGGSGGSGGGGAGGGGGTGGAGDGGSFPACSVLDVTGTIPGVKISIQSSRCVYHVGEAAEFTYEVTTDGTVPAIDIEASSGCGSCTKPSEDPLSFVSYQIGGAAQGGEPQSYCLCDVGCCQPDQAATVQPKATTVSGTIEWSGRNWFGPSDTNNPEGDFFLPGSYGVDVTFNGRAQGTVKATLPIEIIP
jgi:hypothetical protein